MFRCWKWPTESVRNPGTWVIGGVYRKQTQVLSKSSSSPRYWTTSPVPHCTPSLLKASFFLTCTAALLLNTALLLCKSVCVCFNSFNKEPRTLKHPVRDWPSVTPWVGKEQRTYSGHSASKACLSALSFHPRLLSYPMHPATLGPLYSSTDDPDFSMLLLIMSSTRETWNLIGTVRCVFFKMSASCWDQDWKMHRDK